MAVGFNITSEVDKPIYAVKNDFTKNLVAVVNSIISNYQMPMFSLDNIANKVGNVSLSECYGGIRSINEFGPMLDATKPNLYTEITDMRYLQHGGTNVLELTSLMRDTLFIDYLLKSCICYVESFKGTMPTKFYATRNIDLLKYYTTLDKSDRFALPINKDLNSSDVYNKASMLCQPLSLSDIRNGTIKFLKIESKKKGFTLVEPRTVCFVETANLRVTPLFFMSYFADFLFNALENELLKVTYLKDNLQERTVTSTLNLDILTQVFEGNRDKALTVKGYANRNNITRGYMTLPELLLSETDETGCRAISFRVCKIEKVDPATFYNPYLHIDLEGVKVQFENFVEIYSSNADMLKYIYLAIQQYMGTLKPRNSSKEELERIKAEQSTFVKNLSDCSGADVKASILSWLGTCMLLNKTETSRNLHCLMINNPMLFPRYTGRIFQTTSLTNGVDWTSGL